MIKFDRPQNINGTELISELKMAGITVTDFPVLDGNGDFWLNIPAKDEAKAKTIVAAHNGTIIPPDKTLARQAILDRLGLTADEAALLLS
jgi:hypothetical protein